LQGLNWTGLGWAGGALGTPVGNERSWQGGVSHTHTHPCSLPGILFNAPKEVAARFRRLLAKASALFCTQVASPAAQRPVFVQQLRHPRAGSFFVFPLLPDVLYPVQKWKERRSDNEKADRRCGEGVGKWEDIDAQVR
jgi:hypothetical protein